MKATSAQLRALHAEGRRRGLSHDDLRAAVGVSSLTLATGDQIGRALDQLRADRPVPVETGFPTRSRRPRPRLQPGIIRPASAAQRKYLADLMAELGFAPHWLSERHNITDVAMGAYSSATAHAAITQLSNALQSRDSQRRELRRLDAFQSRARKEAVPIESAQSAKSVVSSLEA